MTGTRGLEWSTADGVVPLVASSNPAPRNKKLVPNHGAYMAYIRTVNKDTTSEELDFEIF